MLLELSMFSEVVCIILVCFNNFLIEKTKISDCAMAFSVGNIFKMHIISQKMTCTVEVWIGLAHIDYFNVCSQGSGTIRRVCPSPNNVFLVEVDHLGSSFRFRMHKTGPVSYSLPAACQTRCGTLCSFSSTVTACVPSCFLPWQ